MSWLFYYRTIEIFVYCYTIVNFIPKVWKRIRTHAKENLKNLKKNNSEQIHDTRTKLSKIEGKVTMIARQWEDNQVLSKQNVIDTNNPKAEIENNLNDDPKEDSNSQSRRKSSLLNNEWMERGINIDNKENNEESCNIHRRRNTVIEIAKKFERNESKSKIHMASKAHYICENYFEGKKNTNSENSDQRQHKFNEDSDKSEELVTEIAINRVNNPKPKIDSFDQMTHHCKENQLKDKISYSSHGNVLKQFDDVIKNENYLQEMNESLQDIHQITNGNDEDQHIKESSFIWSQSENEDEEMNEAVTPTNETSSPSSPSPSSTEVTFRRNHNKVQTVEEILKQQRFSRRLSAYSISEFLKDFPNEVEIDEIINNIEK